MTDALKLAEEALEPLAFFERQYKAARKNATRPTGDDIYGIHTGTEFEAMLTHSHLQAADDALTAIRSARAEWGWRPIDTAPQEQRSILAYAPFIQSQLMVYWCLTDACWKYFSPNNRRVEHSLTLWRQLPPPPTREEVGNG